MKKRLIIISCLTGIVCILLFGGLSYTFHLQYNRHNIGRNLCISIDQSGWEMLGNYNEVTFMTYNLNAPYLITVTAENILLKDALQTDKIDIEDLCKYPEETKEFVFDNENETAFIFENYQIILLKNKCMILPLNIDLEKVLQENPEISNE